jgi:DNA-binding SARP family transcriptional activator
MRIEVRLLGSFQVTVDGYPAPAPARRHATALVKLLALTPGHRLSCERVVDALWPDLLLEEARPRLHKAAHYARRALGSQDAVVLRGDSVALAPDAEVVVDLVRFEAAVEAALAAGPAECARAARLCAGELLPDDLYEEWTEEPRERLRRRRLEVLRGAEQWEEVLALDPVDETAHVALLRAAVDAGDRTEALRRYDRMERALAEELGIEPGPEAMALRERARASAAPRRPPPAPTSPAQPRVQAPASSSLLERDGQLSELEELVATTGSTGRGAVVLVTGEAGSGKTALVGALTDRLRDRMPVLEGRCDDLLVQRALGPFRDMAHAGPGPLRDAFVQGGHPDVVLPALLRVLAAGPAVLAVEDVHWADDATIDALRFLGRRISGVPTVLLLTCREDELGRTHPLRQLLGSLGAGVLHRLAVPPLTVDAVASLAADDVDAEQLHRLTRGNAFFVTEVLAADGDDVPETVRDAVLARLAGLPDDVQEVVTRLAVFPSRADRSLAERLAGDRVAALLDAERAGVLAGDAGQVWFRHELARRAVLSLLTPGEHVEANRAVLDALLERGDMCTDIELQAWVVHHARAARRDDLLLSDGPRAAADAVRVGAHRQAAQTLQAVLEVGARLPHAVRADLMTRRSYSLYYVNEFEQALTCAVDAVSTADRTDDVVLQADALASLSKAAFWARGPLAARQAASRAVALLQQVDEPVRRAAALTDLARATGNLATLGVVAEPAGESAGYAEQALRLATELGRDDLRCLALAYRGSARLDDGDPGGSADVEEAIGLATADSRLELRLRACVNAAGSAYRAGRSEEAERYVALGLRLAEDGEFFGAEFRLRLTRASVRATVGRWDDAVGELEELLALPGDPGGMGQLARALLARLRARRGERGAARLVGEALAGPFAVDDPVVSGAVTAAAVEVAWLRGEHEDLPALAADALRSADVHGHRVSRGELLTYLRRAGHVVPPVRTVGPWALSLAGRHREAAEAWAALGDRYEQAVELTMCDDAGLAARGRRLLDQLGATATQGLLHRTVPLPREPEPVTV